MKIIEVVVGIFVLCGVGAMTLLAFNVSGLQAPTTEGNYTIKARFENLGGLTERAKVSMSGVTVGRVSKIYLDQQEYVAVVEMSVDKKYSLFTTDSSAAILTAGLLGEKYIGITSGGEDEYLADGDYIDDTQSAMVLEEMIGRFLVNKVDGK